VASIGDEGGDQLRKVGRWRMTKGSSPMRVELKDEPSIENSYRTLTDG